MNNTGQPNAVVTLNRYRLAVTRNRDSARRAGDEEYSDSQLDAALMRDANGQD